MFLMPLLLLLTFTWPVLLLPLVFLGSQLLSWSMLLLASLQLLLFLLLLISLEYLLQLESLLLPLPYCR
jgi:hypothetical protein